MTLRVATLTFIQFLIGLQRGTAGAQSFFNISLALQMFLMLSRLTLNFDIPLEQ